MDYKNYNTEVQSSISVLEGDHGFHFHRILSRESSVGLSSRIYYRNPGGVPFKWEMQPGMPKSPPRKEVSFPPPSPPPRVQSLWLPKPNCVDKSNKVYSKQYYVSKIWFWKKSKKSQQEIQKVQKGDHDKYENFELGDSDGEFLGSGHDSRSSQSSSSSSSNGNYLHQSKFGREVDKPFSSNPWNMTEILIEEDTSTYYNQRTASANENDGALFKTINFSRDSSVNQSSRLYYRMPGRVPFKWEMSPGASKNPAREEEIPPPSPPPAVQSLGLPTLRAEIQSEASTRNNLFRIWKKGNKINQQPKKIQEISLHKFQKKDFYNWSSSPSSSHTLSSVAKTFCYGAGKSKPKSISSAQGRCDTNLEV